MISVTVSQSMALLTPGDRAPEISSGLWEEGGKDDRADSGEREGTLGGVALRREKEWTEWNGMEDTPPV